jgi:pimeloyl-ACP methyl ester carboxylesterase
MEGAVRFELSFERRPVAGWRWGDSGPAVILVHGWGGRASQLRHFVAPLRASGYRVLAFDAPGHGASPGSELSLPRFARVLSQVASELGPIDALVAHSFGAAASAAAMADGLKPARAVFIGPPSNELRWFDFFSEELALSAPTKRLAKAAIEARVGAAFEDFSAEAMGSRIDVPLLVLHDRLDREVPWEDGERIARVFPGARLLTTTGLGHRRILRSAQVIESVVSFLAGRTPVEPLATGCGRCGAPLLETWGAESELCMSCELSAELANRDLRREAIA